MRTIKEHEELMKKLDKRSLHLNNHLYNEHFKVLVNKGDRLEFVNSDKTPLQIVEKWLNVQDENTNNK